MRGRRSYDAMSAHDAGYLSRETDEQPLHYVLELTVPDRISLAQVREHVALRLAALPLLHRRPRYPLLAGRPVWVDDVDFSVERQVVGWPALATAAARDAAFRDLTMRRIPRDRPLWQLVVADDAGGGTTLWLCVHHAMMDGGLLANTLRELFGDAVPSGEWRPRRGPSRIGLLSRAVLRRAVRRGASPSAASRGSALPTSLTGPVSTARALADVTLPLADVRHQAKAAGITVNDLFLAAVTAGLRGYLPEVPETVVALVPRDVRTAEEADAIGNRGWSMLVPLPTGVDAAAERLAAITAATAEGKSADRTSGTQGWAFDVALTNVRLGSGHAACGVPLGGHRVSVPLQGSNRLVVVATSREDDFTLSFVADGAVFPDIARLAGATADALSPVSTR